MDRNLGVTPQKPQSIFGQHVPVPMQDGQRRIRGLRIRIKTGNTELIGRRPEDGAPYEQRSSARYIDKLEESLQAEGLE